MPKSIAEIERLKINAQSQNVLMGRFIKDLPKNTQGQYTTPQRGVKGVITATESIIQNQSNDIHQPVGEIDYSRFNKSASKAKK